MSQNRDFSLGNSEGQGHCGGSILHLCIFWQLSGTWPSPLWNPTYWYMFRRRKGHVDPLPPFKGQGNCPVTYPHVFLVRARSTCSPEPLAKVADLSELLGQSGFTLRHVEGGILSETRFPPGRKRGMTSEECSFLKV